MESVAAFAWNGWQASSGISGRLGLEYATYARIKAGKPISLKGQGFRWDDVPDQDYWHFNKSSADSIYVNTDGGGDIFKGTFGDGDVWVETEDVS